ncbi:MAG: alpha-N-arabinofuranosidase [Planctomycetaceae bacterium]|nr:alpha-N-arabinofuranosidase [Planctomycetaceae bacterium]
MNKLWINADQPVGTIDKHVYGHFSEHLGRCIYDGYWTGEKSSIPNTRGIRNDIVKALKKMGIPNLRWPGGCFADEYHWMDGIGPRNQRPKMINTHWGGVVENNHFGTHEFFDLCEQLGTEPYICGNVGSGTVQEMQQWVEYITFDGKSPMTDLRRKNGREKPWKIKFWGVGNENWGCGGSMRPEYYADNYRRYATYCRNFSGNQLFRIACGSWNDNYNWTDVLMRECYGRMQGLSYHFYCGSGKNSRSATQFEEIDWAWQLKTALQMDEFVARHSTVMDKYDPQASVPLVVDEWGAWHACEPGTNPGFLYQQNSIRDALVAGVTFNIFHKHCKRVRIANIAQTINVLQAVVLTEGKKMILTPTYHVFDMFQVHQDAAALNMAIESDNYVCQDVTVPAVSASASKDAAGKVHVSLCNLDADKAQEISGLVRGADGAKITGTVLTAPAINTCNTFDKPNAVKPQDFDGATLKAGKLTVKLPPRSVVVLEIA